jgi:hypothetical protein
LSAKSATSDVEILTDPFGARISRPGLLLPTSLEWGTVEAEGDRTSLDPAMLGDSCSILSTAWFGGVVGRLSIARPTPSANLRADLDPVVLTDFDLAMATMECRDWPSGLVGLIGLFSRLRGLLGTSPSFRALSRSLSTLVKAIRPSVRLRTCSSLDRESWFAARSNCTRVATERPVFDSSNSASTCAWTADATNVFRPELSLVVADTKAAIRFDRSADSGRMVGESIPAEEVEEIKVVFDAKCFVNVSKAS